MSSAASSLSQAISSLGSMRLVENVINDKLSSEAPLLHQVSSYLLSLGGKRIRPVLTLLTAQAFGLGEPFSESASGRSLIDVAAGIELIHMATLLHDDIIDKSPLRRHKQSAFIKFGINNTLLTGDFLLVRAFGLCARLDRFIIDATEAACVALTEGEIIETPLHLERHSQASSLEIARKKTAALFKLSALSAGHLAGLTSSAVDNLANFGEALGVAFQLVDDILDVNSTLDLLGKRTGQDLIEKKPSIVNVLWLESGSPLAAQVLLEPGEVSASLLEQALSELRQHQALEGAKQLAIQYASSAEVSLNACAKTAGGAVCGKSYAVLTDLIKFVFERVS